MQESAYDYSNVPINSGCCLNCQDSHQGCLCHNCKCKQCYWYSSPQQYDGIKGHCDKTDFLAKKRRKELKIKYEIEERIDFEKGEKLRRENNKILAKIKKKKEIASYYSCQKCCRGLITHKELIIKRHISPICDVCDGKISLTDEEIEKIKLEVLKENE